MLCVMQTKLNRVSSDELKPLDLHSRTISVEKREPFRHIVAVWAPRYSCVFGKSAYGESYPKSIGSDPGLPVDCLCVDRTLR